MRLLGGNEENMLMQFLRSGPRREGMLHSLRSSSVQAYERLEMGVCSSRLSHAQWGGEIIEWSVAVGVIPPMTLPEKPVNSGLLDTEPENWL